MPMISSQSNVKVLSTVDVSPSAPASTTSTIVPKIVVKRIPLILASYVITFTVFLMGSMNRSGSMDSAPFLTHLDLPGNSNGGGGASCSQKTFDMLPKLIAKINENYLVNALIPLNITLDHSTYNDQTNTKTETLTMPGLHLDSFRHKRTAFLGDSTIFYMAKWLVSMLRHEESSLAKGMGSIPYHTMKNEQGNSVVQNNKHIMLKGTSVPPPFRKDDTWFEWYGMSGNSHGLTEVLLDKMFLKSEAMKPQVVVANMAFHWFQLCGYSSKMCPTPMDSPLISRWLHYDESWLQRVYDHAIKVDAKLLLFKTANFICGTKRTGDWLTGDTLYQKFDNATLDACVTRLEPFGKELFASTEDVRRFCTYGQFTDVGSRYLNDKMVEFVKKVQERDRSEGGSRLTVGLYNDHDVENCDTTDDAIHHKKGVVMRLRLLANTIDSYLKCARE